MDVIDLLIMIVVVTILVTIILAVVTYVAYKLRLAREPSEFDRKDEGLQYFVRYVPESSPDDMNELPEAGAEGHATEA